MKQGLPKQSPDVVVAAEEYATVPWRRPLTSSKTELGQVLTDCRGCGSSIDADNIASVAVARAIGFEPTGDATSPGVAPAPS
ncbi:hypothetical protein [Micromonospora sp. NPDC005206]|uniref:hypothetical protein n=1 Tax=Micromonospora sp. NPDC005206 TaxID=3157022 RepID=UPI0033BED142